MNELRIVAVIGAPQYLQAKRDWAENMMKNGDACTYVPFNSDPVDSSPHVMKHLDAVQYAFIDQAEQVHIINTRGYIDEHTKMFLQYAHDAGKSISFDEKPYWQARKPAKSSPRENQADSGDAIEGKGS